MAVNDAIALKLMWKLKEKIRGKYAKGFARILRVFKPEGGNEYAYPETNCETDRQLHETPGIEAVKTALKPTPFYTIDMKDEVVNEFAKSLLSVKRDLHFVVSAETSSRRSIPAKYVEILPFT